MKETYTISVICGNCDYSGTISIPKGTPFDEYGLGKYGGLGGKECPMCGCYSLIKTHSERKPRWNEPFMGLGNEGDNKFLCVVQKDTATLTRT